MDTNKHESFSVDTLRDQGILIEEQVGRLSIISGQPDILGRKRSFSFENWNTDFFPGLQVRPV